LTAAGNQKTVKKWKYLIIGPSMVLSEDSRKHTIEKHYLPCL
jgi:hypothetical protein